MNESAVNQCNEIRKVPLLEQAEKNLEYYLNEVEKQRKLIAFIKKNQDILNEYSELSDRY